MCDFSKIPLNKLLILLNNIEKQQSELEQYHKLVFEEIDSRFPNFLSAKNNPKTLNKSK